MWKENTEYTKSTKGYEVKWLQHFIFFLFEVQANIPLLYNVFGISDTCMISLKPCLMRLRCITFRFDPFSNENQCKLFFSLLTEVTCLIVLILVHFCSQKIALFIMVISSYKNILSSLEYTVHTASSEVKSVGGEIPCFRCQLSP